MPVGMHRPKPSKWKNVWPFLAILVIVPALGWAAATALSRQQAQILNQAGYAGTSAANADGWATQTSTVFYEDPRMEGTAKDVAAKLGISNVRQESGLGDPDIIVVLR